MSSVPHTPEQCNIEILGELQKIRGLLEQFVQGSHSPTIKQRNKEQEKAIFEAQLEALDHMKPKR